jgi:hypothetical protein
MAYTIIKELMQWKFLGELGYSHNGVCYYISEYVEQQVWKRPQVGSYQKALEAAQNARTQIIVNAAKAKNMAQRRVPQQIYQPTTGPLAINSLYRVALWVESQSINPPTPQSTNHEIILVTGQGAKVIFLEPNFGFHQSDRDSMNFTNKDAFEWAVDDLYSDGKYCATNFHYKRVRGL